MTQTVTRDDLARVLARLMNALSAHMRREPGSAEALEVARVEADRLVALYHTEICIPSMRKVGAL